MTTGLTPEAGEIILAPGTMRQIIPALAVGRYPFRSKSEAAGRGRSRLAVPTVVNARDWRLLRRVTQHLKD